MYSSARDGNLQGSAKAKDLRTSNSPYLTRRHNLGAGFNSNNTLECTFLDVGVRPNLFSASNLGLASTSAANITSFIFSGGLNCDLIDRHVHGGLGILQPATVCNAVIEVEKSTPETKRRTSYPSKVRYLLNPLHRFLERACVYSPALALSPQRGRSDLRIPQGVPHFRTHLVQLIELGFKRTT